MAAHLLCGEVMVFGSLDAIDVLDCDILYIYIYIYIYIFYWLLKTTGMAHLKIYQTTRRYMAEDGTRSSSCLIATNLHREIIMWVSQVASQAVSRDGKPLFQSAVSRGPRIWVQCASGKTMFSVTVHKSKCRRRLAPPRRHVSRLPNTLRIAWRSLT